MKIKFRIFLILPLMFLLSAVLDAADFSLITNQYAEAGNQDTGESKFNEYRMDILPSFSFLFGDMGDFTLSAKISFGQLDEFFWTPELQRTEFSWRWGSMGFRAGRMNYADPLGFIAAGLFDGVQFEYNSRAGIFSAGVWYTGLLYKKTAYIIMKPEEQTAFNVPVDLADLDTYFASRRLLASLDWEHLSVAQLLHLNAAITAQVDLSDSEEKYNSQYVTLKAIIPIKSFTFELGGSFETTETEKENVTVGFAGDLGIFWKLPSGFNSRLSLTGSFSSGETRSIMKNFVPLTNKFYGDILKLKFMGVTILGMSYSALFVPSFGIAFNASHFVRNDLVTYTGYPLNPEKKDTYGIFLGTEFFAQLVWSPFSDLQINLEGGIFFPSLGNAAPDEKPRWRADLLAVLALY